MTKQDTKTIQKAAVIGAGVMGSGIAAHLANAGIAVHLLDIVPQEATDRNMLASQALSRLQKSNPAAFMHKSCAQRIIPGNIEDDLPALTDVDWVIEAVWEDFATKKQLYQKLAEYVGKKTIISSNTSTIPLAELMKAVPSALQDRFLITHFFNPPRYLRLLEIVAGSTTQPEIIDKIRQFADYHLGKTVLHCKDTPGFIANRIGTFWIQSCLNTAFDMKLPIEEADAVMGRPFGLPKTGIFGLLDLVGLDLMPHVAKSLLQYLPQQDAYRSLYRVEDMLSKMISAGYTGRKGKGGFYRMIKDQDGHKQKLVIDLQTGEERPATKPYLSALKLVKKEGLYALLTHQEPAARYARKVWAQTLSYAASLVPEIAQRPDHIDAAMRLGYNWQYGPFELIDQIGGKNLITILQEENISVPPLLQKAADQEGFYRHHKGQLHILTLDGGYEAIERPQGVLLLSDIKRRSEAVRKNSSAALWDIGKGVLCLEFTGPHQALDQQVMELIEETIEFISEQDKYRGLVIYNEGTHFSVGANLGLAIFAINVGVWSQIEALIEAGQRAYTNLKHAPFPVVGAPANMALGGGCEILLHCDAIQAHAELYTGLVEAGVGLIPGWGGCREMLLRAQKAVQAKGPMPAPSEIFQIIGTAFVAKSAFEAQEKLFLRPTDGITMNRDRLLYDAREKVLALTKDYTPPTQNPPLDLPGISGHTAMMLAVKDMAARGLATPHDQVIADYLAHVLSGGDKDLVQMMGADEILTLEKDAFMKLVKDPASIARIEHMLTTNKPLRN